MFFADAASLCEYKFEQRYQLRNSLNTNKLINNKSEKGRNVKFGVGDIKWYKTDVQNVKIFLHIS